MWYKIQCVIPYYVPAPCYIAVVFLLQSTYLLGAFFDSLLSRSCELHGARIGAPASPGCELLTAPVAPTHKVLNAHLRSHMLTPRRSQQTVTCVIPSYLKLHRQSVISLQATHRTSSLLSRNMNTQYFLWRQIQDIIGEADTWPTRIRKLFWTRNLEFWQLVMLSLFACVNGLPAPVFKAWIQL